MSTLDPATQSSQKSIGSSVLLILTALILIGLGAYLLTLPGNRIISVGGLVSISLGAAVVTGGILHSTGLIKIRYGEFGGAAAIFIATFFFTSKFIDRDFSVSGIIYLDDLPASNCAITLLEQNVSGSSVSVGPNGDFRFSGLRERPNELVLKISIEGFVPTLVKKDVPSDGFIRIRLSRKNLLRPSAILSPRIISTGEVTSPYGFSSPPTLEASMIHDDGEPRVRLEITKQGRVTNFDALESIHENEIWLQRNTNDGSWVLRCATAGVVSRRYSKTPHGRYHAVIALTSNKNTHPTLKSETNWNYLYRLWSNRDPLVGNSKAFKVYDRRAVKAINSSQAGTNFVDALLAQSFDLKGNFFIRGSFTIRAQKQGVNPALEISLGNGGADKVSIIMGEDQGDAHTIKSKGEGIIKKGPIHQRNKIEDSGTWIKRDGETENFFEIRFVVRLDPERLDCDLYLGQLWQRPGADRPVFSRSFPQSILGDALTTIRFKLWQNGIAEISQLEIGELPSGRS